MRQGPYLIIANPTSGRGRGRRLAVELRDCLRQQGDSVEIQFTERREHARELTKAACDSPGELFCIVACGGDGTIQQVAGAIAESVGAMGERTPVLGLAPCGRCNDFAREFGIASSIASMMAALANGEIRKIDLGRVDGRYFCTVATVGIDAAISAYVDGMSIPIKGTPAYVYAAIRVLMSYDAPILRLEGDFGIIEQPAMLASSANTRSYGGAIQLVPQADPCDGLLHVCVVDRISRRRALQLIPQVLRGKHMNHPNVQFASTRSLHVRADRPLEIWADGERVGSTPAKIEVIPQAIRLLVPPT